MYNRAMDIGEIQEFFPEITGMEDKKAQLKKLETELNSLRKQVIERAREQDRKGTTIWIDPDDFNPHGALNNGLPSVNSLAGVYKRIGEMEILVKQMQAEVKQLENTTEVAKKAFEELKKEVAKKQETEWDSPIGGLSLDE